MVISVEKIGIASNFKQMGRGFERQNEYSPTPIGEEKSELFKYMVGATTVAAVVALGIVGRKGHLGKPIQKLLGGVKKSDESLENIRKFSYALPKTDINTSGAKKNLHEVSEAKVFIPLREYENGKIASERVFWKNGKLKSDTEFVDGQPVKKKSFSPKGDWRSVTTFRDGKPEKEIISSPDRYSHVVREFVDGEEVKSTHIVFKSSMRRNVTVYENGEIAKKTTYIIGDKEVLPEFVKGKPEELPVNRAFWDPLVQRVYSKGKPVSELKFDSDTGQLVEKSEFKNGRLSKRIIYKGDEQHVDSVEDFSRGALVKSSKYDNFGHLVSQSEYKDGDIVRVTDFYPNGKPCRITDTPSVKKTVETMFYESGGPECVYEYDLWFIRKETHYGENGKISLLKEMDYNKDGTSRIVKETSYDKNGITSVKKNVEKLVDGVYL